MKSSLILMACMCATAVVPYVQPGNLYGVPAASPTADAALRVSQLPEAFGEWMYEGLETNLDDGVVEELGIYTYTSRIYRHRMSGDRVSLLLMLGTPGRLVRHPPDICYSNRGSRALDKRVLTLSPEDDAHSFATLTYASTSPMEPLGFAVAYGYTTGQKWDVPRFPRLTYGGEDVLYKMQVLVAPNEHHDTEALVEINHDFLRDFINAFAHNDIKQGT